MRRSKRGSQGPHALDPEFLEALSESESGSRSSDRQAQRKARQFCRQAQRAINLALAETNASLFVDEVVPAPDCGRLLAYVVVAAPLPVVEAMAELRRETPRLRAEVARSIARKRAPELVFVPAVCEGGGDD